MSGKHTPSPLSPLLIGLLGVSPSPLVRAGVHLETEHACSGAHVLEGERARPGLDQSPQPKEALGVQGMPSPLLLPRFLLSKLLQWNIIAFHFIFKNCCQGSLLAS